MRLSEIISRPTTAQIQAVIDYLQFNGEEVERRDAESALVHVMPLLGGKTTIYRVMRLTTLQVENLKAGASLGLYWSASKDIPRDNLLADESEGEWFIFEAQVEGRSIDIIETAGARLLN